MKKKKNFIFIIFCWFFLLNQPFINLSQIDKVQQKIDSLTNILEDSEGEEKLKLLNQLAFAYTDVENADSTVGAYAGQALEMAIAAKNEVEKTKAFRTLALAYIDTKKDTSLDFAKSALSSAKITGDKNLEGEVLNILSQIYYHTASLDSSIQFANLALKISAKSGNKHQQAASCNLLGISYFNKGQYENASENWEKASQLYEQLGRKDAAAEALGNLGLVYKNLGEYEKAITYYQQALKKLEELGKTYEVAANLYNIGNVYFTFGKNYSKAYEYYQQALENFEKIGFKIGVAYTYSSMGLVLGRQKKYDSALVNFNHAIEIFEEAGHKLMIADSHANIAEIFADQEKYNEAIDAALKAKKISEELGNKKQLVSDERNIGMIYKKWGNNLIALNYYKNSLEMAREMKLNELIQQNLKDLSEIYGALGNYQKALDYFREYSDIKDSTFTADQQKVIQEMETKYETDKKEQQIELEKAKVAEAEAKRQQEEEANKRTLWVIGVILLSIIIIAIVVYRQYLIKKKANEELALRNAEISQQKEEIEAQRDEIERQRDVVVKQKQEITDSIQYASRIQRALLPPDEALERVLPEYFVLNRPRDIVSGDFYWMNEKDGIVTIAAADCTGHGVPGAFMSMLGVSFLTEISTTPDAEQADKILNTLREHIMASLRQTGKEHEAKDGMDIALCMIDFENLKLQYAGAYNPLILIRDNELETIKADKMPIGIHFKGNIPFTNNEIQLQKGDTLYIFSDGYCDQFGGSKGRKFMAKRFKQILVDIHQKPLPEQKEVLNNTIEDWMHQEYEQVDDMLVIGIRV